MLVTRKWKGSNSNHSLELFVQQHRAAFAAMQSCAVHVDFKLPNGHARVGYLLNGIECDDAALLAAITKVEEDDTPTGKRSDFELCATHLLPKDPVVKKRLLIFKCSAGQISGVDTGTGPRDDIGLTGVHYQYYTPDEFAGLTHARRDDLRTQMTNYGSGLGGGGGGGGGRGG